MSSFYDDASLVVIPSGYKTSKVYAEKPTDGSGDLAFTRTGDTATRVNSAGLIEKVRTNLATFSEDFANAAWGKTDITVTANTTANPVNGAATADTLTRTGGAVGFVNRQIAQTGIVTFSVFAKAGSTNLVRLNTYDGAVDRGATYNLTTGAITGAYGSPLFTTAQSFGNGWYRISVSVNSATYTRCQIHIDTVNSVIAFGAMLETGDVMTDYIATTTAAVSVGPVANVPRLDYLGSTCPRLLLEPQRTNLATFSEQFNNAAWTKSSATVTANTSVSPDGYTNADTLVITSGGYLLQQFAGYSAVSGQGVSISIFVKNQTNGFLAFGGATPAGTDVYRIENYGNGWYRHSVVRTFTVTTTGTVQYIILTVGTHIIWGAQVEGSNSSYPTSYIPTLAASATRGADACSKTGISSLIGQTEGTLFVDFTINGLANFGTPISVNNGTSLQSIWLTIFANGNLRAELYNGATQASITYSGAVVGGRYKMAFGYKTNDFVLYVNGAQVGTDNSGTTFSGTTLSRVDTDLANASVYSTASESINQALLFTTRLTNAALAELTTL